MAAGAWQPATQISTYMGTGLDHSAGRGVDGIIDPAEDPANMFHTGNDRDAWWQVDLGSVHPLARIVLFNRAFPADPSDEVPRRANTIQVLLSQDGTSWDTVHDQGGRDWERLDIDVAGRQARFVKLQLAEANCLHLYEVEVYGMP